MFWKVWSTYLGWVLGHFSSGGQHAKHETETCPRARSQGLSWPFQFLAEARAQPCQASLVSRVTEGSRHCPQEKSPVLKSGIFVCRHRAWAMFCSPRSSWMSWTVQINPKGLVLGPQKQTQLARQPQALSCLGGGPGNAPFRSHSYPLIVGRVESIILFPEIFFYALLFKIMHFFELIISYEEFCGREETNDSHETEKNAGPGFTVLMTFLI